MGIRINQNIMAMNSYRNLTTSESQLSKSLEKLSSGFRINKAADDASGLVISEGLRSQVNGLKMAIRNTQDGISVVQTAEGALTEVHSLLQRMRELAVQAASTGSSDTASRAAAQAEVVQLKAEVDRISSTTRFGGSKLLDGSYGVTQATVSGTSTAGFTISAAAAAGSRNNTFTFDIDGAGAGAAQTVTLDDAVYTTVDATNAAALQKNLTDNITAALATAGLDYEAFEVEVEVVGANFRTTISGTKGNSFAVATTTEPIFTELGITPGTFTSTGSGGVFQVGASANETITFAIGTTATAANGLNITGIDVSTAATAAITSLDAAIEEISVLRGDLGALQNRFEHTINNLSVTMENLSASESRIRDTDMASEMMQFTRAQILQQAGTAMLAQANALPQSVLQLLQ